MKLIMESWRRYLLKEDYADFRGKSLEDIMSEMKTNLEGKTLVFFDLETIQSEMDVANQITQIAAFSYKVDDLAQGISGVEETNYVAKLSLGAEAGGLQAAQRGWTPEERVGAEEAYFKGGGWGEYMTVDDLLDFQRYDKYLPDLPEEEIVDELAGIKGFFKYLGTLDNPVLIAHNLLKFDKKKLIGRSEFLSIDSAVFNSLPTFDTMVFANEVFGAVVKLSGKEFKDQEAKDLVIKFSKVKKYFSMALESLLAAFAEGETQMHTADDDTRRLVDAFFKMYNLLEVFVGRHNTEGGLSSSYTLGRKQGAVIKAIQKKLGGSRNPAWRKISRSAYGEVRAKQLEDLENLLNPELTYLDGFIKSLQRVKKGVKK